MLFSPGISSKIHSKVVSEAKKPSILEELSQPTTTVGDKSTREIRLLFIQKQSNPTIHSARR